MKRYISCLILACAATLAFAADNSSNSKLGVFGSIHDSSPMIGIELTLSDTLKLKPALGFVFSSNPDQNATYEITGVGFYSRVDLLINMKIASGLSLGIGPSIGFDSSSTTNKYTTDSYKYSVTTFAVGGVANVKYLFSKNFGAFLDGGLSLSFATTKIDPLVGDTTKYTITSVNTSTALGLIFYF